MYQVTVTGTFSATHQLRLPDGSFEPLHEHEWHVLAAWVGPELDGMGVLVDFTVVRPVLDEILADLAGLRLNDHPAFGDADGQRAYVNPSAELVARHIADRLAADERARDHLAWVEVEEEPGCFGRFSARVDAVVGCSRSWG